MPRSRGRRGQPPCVPPAAIDISLLDKKEEVIFVDSLGMIRTLGLDSAGVEQRGGRAFDVLHVVT